MPVVSDERCPDPWQPGHVVVEPNALAIRPSPPQIPQVSPAMVRDLLSVAAISVMHRTSVARRCGAAWSRGKRRQGVGEILPNDASDLDAACVRREDRPASGMNKGTNTAYTVVYVGDDHAAAILGGILFFIVRDDPRPIILEYQQQWMAQLKKNSPEGSAFITVLRADTPPPAEPARKLIKRVFAEFGQVVSAGAMVIEGEGFVAATFRSVLSMIALALRPNYPFKIFANLHDGSEWVLKYVGPSGRVAVTDLVNALERVKTDYSAGTLVVSA
jgi:hypothetical protein